MIHHASRAIHHTAKHSHRLLRHLAGYYSRDPGKIIDHGTAVYGFAGAASKALGRKAVKHGPAVVKAGGVLALNGGVRIGKMVWTHGPKVAKHSAKFMLKSAVRGFKLFS